MKSPTRFYYAYETNALRDVAALLRDGKLAAFPTDTVYGAGTSAFDTAAVERLYTVKGRARNKPIPLLVSGYEQLDSLITDLDPLARRLIERFWPGALTLILPRRPDVPDIIGAGGDSVAVRMPAHVLTLALINEVGTPLATTSANISGNPSPLDAFQVSMNLEGKLDAILDAGPCPGGIDSTVVDTRGGTLRVLRETAIAARTLREAVKDLI